MTKHPVALAITVAFATSIALSGCDRTSNLTEVEHIQRAKDFETKGDLKASIIELKNAAQKNPNSAEARWLLGQVYVKAGQGNEAEKELLKARQLGVADESVKAFLGDALLLQGEFQKVLTEINPDAKTSSKNLAKILRIRGDALLGLRRRDEGCDLFKQSLQADSQHVPAYWGLASCAVAAGDLPRAKGHLDQALKLDEKNALTRVFLGDWERMSNNPQGAIAAYSNALKLDPSNFLALYNRASVQVNMRQYAAAQKDIDAMRKLAPSYPLVDYAQALVYFHTGKHREALEAIQQVQKVEPGHMPSLLLSGAIQFSLGSYLQAEASVSNYLAHIPNNPYARKLLAAALLKENQADRALEVLKPLLGQQTPDVDALSLAGEGSLRANAIAKAAEYFEKAAAIDPSSASARTGLGVSQLAAGNVERAAKEFASASTLDSGGYKAEFLLVQAYLASKQYDKAVEAIAALEKKQPNNPETPYLRGLAYSGKGDFANARKSFERALTLQPAFYYAARDLAQLDLKDKDPNAARKRFETVLAADKNNLAAMLALSNLAAGQGQEKEYVAWLERAAKAHPAALSPRAFLARYYLKKKEPAKALVFAREAQSADPKNPLPLHLLGTIQFSAGEKENAVTSYTELTKMAPKWPLAYYDLAGAQVATKNTTSAKASLIKALELEPGYLDAKVALSKLELQAGRPAEALKLAQQIQQQVPKLPFGFVLEGDIRMAQAKFADAALAYEKGLAITKDSFTAVKIYLARSRAGDVKRADAGLLQWLKEYPEDLAARGHLAQTYMQSGRNKEAIEQYNFVLQKQPNSVSVLNNLALLYQQEKDPRALPTAEQANKLQPDNAAVLDTLGWILVEQGSTVRGVQALQKAAKTAPRDAGISFHYAAALAKSGDKSGARKQLDALLGSGQKFPEMEKAKALRDQL